MVRRRAAFGASCVAAALAAACAEPALTEVAGGPDGIGLPAPADLEPSLVIGIESDLPAVEPVAAVIARVDVAGAPEPERRIDLALGSAGFPLEVAVPHAKNGTRFDIALEAVDASGETLLTRRGATVARDGRTLLLRLRLEDECTPVPAYDDDGECAASTTCIAGICRPYYVPPETLDDYTEDWAVPYADACKPIEGGAPELELGQGRESFEEITPLETMQFEAGNQGGYHVWLATRAHNLHHEGALTFFEARVDQLGLELHPWTSTLDYDPAPLGCEMVGYPFRLYPTGDQVDLDPADLDGQLVHFEAIVLDSVGDAAYAELSVTLSAQ